MTLHVDALKIAEMLMGWANQALPGKPVQGMSLAGKVLASTLKDCDGAQQDFVTVVSACMQRNLSRSGCDSSGSSL